MEELSVKVKGKDEVKSYQQKLEFLSYKNQKTQNDENAKLTSFKIGITN